MNTAAQNKSDQALQLISTFADELDGAKTELYRIREGLEDGAALAFHGLGDDDQVLVEEAHGIVTDWIVAGHTSYEEVTAPVTSFMGYSVGLNARINGKGKPVMLKVEFHHIADNTGDVQLRLVSGNTLGEVPVRRVRVKHAVWDALPHSRGSSEEALWALEMLGAQFTE